MSGALALRIYGAIMLFMGINMIFFTEGMADSFKVSGLTDATKFMMKAFGWQMLWQVGPCFITATVGDNKSLGTVAFVNFVQQAFWLGWSFVKGFDDAEKMGMATDGIWLNVAVCAVTSIVCGYAWMSAGMPMPSVPSFGGSSTKTCIAVCSAVQVLFGGMMAFNQKVMFDGYLKGVEFTALEQTFIEQMMFNMGVLMLTWGARNLFVVGADNKQVIYGINRWNCFLYAMNFGGMASQEMVNKHLGWPNDGFKFNFFLFGGLFAYSMWAMIGSDFEKGGVFAKKNKKT